MPITWRLHVRVLIGTSNNLSFLARPDEAMAAAAEAVDVARRRHMSDRGRLALAGALHELAAQRTRSADPPGAVDALEEALRILSGIPRDQDGYAVIATTARVYATHGRIALGTTDHCAAAEQASRTIDLLGRPRRLRWRERWMLAGAQLIAAKAADALGQPDRAVTAGLAALETYRRTPWRHRLANASQITSARLTVAQLLADAGQHTEAQKLTKGARRLAWFVADEPDLGQNGKLIEAIRRYAEAHIAGQTDDHENAAETARLAVEKIRELVRDDRYADHESYLSSALRLLASAQVQLDRPADALTGLSEAVGIDRRLTSADLTAHGHRYAWSLVSLGEVCLQVGDTERAVYAGDTAVSTARELTERVGVDHELLLASLDIVVTACHRDGRNAEAFAAAQSAVVQAEARASSAADPNRVEVTRRLRTVSHLQLGLDLLEDGLASAVQAQEYLGDGHSRAERRELALILSCQVDALRALDRDDEAIEVVSRAIDLYAELLEPAADELTEHIRMLRMRGYSRHSMQDFDGALSDVNAAIALSTRPDLAREVVWWLLAEKVAIYDHQGRLDDAVRTLQELRTRLREADEDVTLIASDLVAYIDHDDAHDLRAAWREATGESWPPNL